MLLSFGMNVNCPVDERNLIKFDIYNLGINWTLRAVTWVVRCLSVIVEPEFNPGTLGGRLFSKYFGLTLPVVNSIRVS
jgi:hypothetical protein